MRMKFMTMLFAMLFPFAIQAQDLPLISDGVTRVDSDGLLIATCRQGEGCHCYQSNHSLSSLQTQLGIDPPEGVANPVLVRIDNDVFWTDHSPHALDFTYGGEGLCDPEIFDPSESHLPRNGSWEMRITGHQLSGCPAEVAAAITGEVVVGQFEQRNIVWPRPFSVAPLTADNPAGSNWVNRGGGVWTTDLFNTRGEMGANARVAMTARVLSQTEIALTSVFSTDVLAVLTGETCRSTTEATLRFRG